MNENLTNCVFILILFIYLLTSFVRNLRFEFFNGVEVRNEQKNNINLHRN